MESLACLHRVQLFVQGLETIMPSGIAGIGLFQSDQHVEHGCLKVFEFFGSKVLGGSHMLFCSTTLIVSKYRRYQFQVLSVFCFGALLIALQELRQLLVRALKRSGFVHFCDPLGQREGNLGYLSRSSFPGA